jgi:uncharacterized protein YecE (DUF72 family)
VFYVGTAGYSYQDWIGPFYPPGTRKEDMLSFYAREFNFTELNATFYAMPGRELFYRLAQKTPPEFRFAVKLHQSVTHTRERPLAESAGRFRAALEPLVREQKLGCLLAQFPYSFKKTAENLAYLGALRRELPDLPLAVEFRHRSWITQETMGFLSHEGLAYVCVDEPGLPNLVRPVAAATAEIAYVRFHGRNAAKWWHHTEAWERYDYEYSEGELAEWVPRLRCLAEQAHTVYVVFNNHPRGQAINNARVLRRLLAL